MTTIGSLLVSGLYGVLSLSLFFVERRRMRQGGVDGITIFIVIFGLQCCLPGIVIFGALPFAGAAHPTGNEFFDKVLLSVDMATALLVFSLTVWFVVSLYVGCALTALVLRGRVPVATPAVDYHLVVRDRRLVVVLLVGLVVTWSSFMALGDNFLARYANLILFRAGSENIERTTLNAAGLVLTQAWSWLTIVALFAVRERRGRGIAWTACLTFLVVFAVLGVSRRSLFLPILLAYLTLLVYDGSWRKRWILAVSVPLLLVVAFGKSGFSAIAEGRGLQDVARTYESFASTLMRPTADIGITVVESLGTLQFVDVGMRFGVDHLLSIAQRFPEGMLGWDLAFPERIVRISTTAFSNANAQDIPPGLFGQMWLDFGVLGPLVWGLVFGIQVGIAKYLFDRVRLGRSAAAVYTLVIFIVALPLNSGSFDFTFSIDIFAAVLALMVCIRLRRVSDPVPEPA